MCVCVCHCAVLTGGVHTWQPWCRKCAALKPKYANLARAYGDRVIFIKMDVENKEARALIKERAGVKYVHTHMYMYMYMYIYMYMHMYMCMYMYMYMCMCMCMYVYIAYTYILQAHAVTRRC